jgi:adenylate cyclase
MASTTQRKLTAILSADVVGYSRLMGADEEATIETLTAYRKVFVSHIEGHSGRVVDAKGDAILAEFASVVDAVNSAVEIQRELAEKNTELPDDRRMDFRIGINLGDVVLKDDMIYGDGVNVAARLEALAEPGGICISRSAYDQVESKLNIECEYLGEQQVKNIAKPVRAYKVRLESAAISEAPEKADATAEAPQEFDKGSRIPSLAVLPFANMSGDEEQEYFSDGITEDLITALSNISRLSVVSRNTAFTYKGQPVNVKQVGKELGVRYLLEGSVRKAGNRVRITAQLIDAETDRHLWSERYDRELEDVFAVQDEITRHIVEALDVGLLDGEQIRVWRDQTQNGEAWDCFLQARNILQGTRTRQGLAKARRLWERAVALDGKFARAISALAGLHFVEARQGWGRSFEESLAKALELVNKALALDDSLAYAHMWIALYHLYTGEHDQALALGEKAVGLNPDGADVMGYMAMIQLCAGRHVEAHNTIQRALGLAPAATSNLLNFLGLARLLLGRPGEALPALGESLQATPDYLDTHVILAAVYGALGRDTDARGEMQEILRLEPEFNSDERVPRLFPFKDEKDLERMKELLRKAGLPEQATPSPVGSP